jgi:hypothetical protein
VRSGLLGGTGHCSRSCLHLLGAVVAAHRPGNSLQALVAYKAPAILAGSVGPRLQAVECCPNQLKLVAVEIR